MFYHCAIRLPTSLIYFFAFKKINLFISVAKAIPLKQCKQRAMSVLLFLFWHYELSITTFSIATLSKFGLFATLSIIDT
jgi:hypothetical protein